MFESICSLPTTSDIFCLVLHPSKPLLTVGLASGHVETFEVPAPIPASTSKPKKTAFIRSVWRTKRHQGSCRALAYQDDGSRLFSTGTDKLVKGFGPEDGRVNVKFAVETPDGSRDDPANLLVLNPTTLIVASDSAWVTIHDIENPEKKNNPLQPHGDFVTSMAALQPSEASTSGVPKQWISVGENTVAVSDMRKGVADDSGEQDELLTAMCYVPTLRARKTSKKLGVVVSGSDQGVVKIWDPTNLEKPVHKIKVFDGESIDSMVQLPESLGMGMLVACGFGDGIIRVVDLRARKLVEHMNLAHDNLQGEPVMALGVDCYGRLISGGGQIVKIWEELSELQGDDGEDEDEDEEEDDGEEDEGDSAEEKPGKSSKRAREKDSEEEQEEEESDDDSDSCSDSVSKGEGSKKEEQREAEKKRKLGPMGAHGILKFDGLD